MPLAPRADLVEVAIADDMHQAELMRGLLEERGIHSVTESTTFDGRNLGMALPMPSRYRVKAHADRAAEARRLLEEALVAVAHPESDLEALEGGGRSYGVLKGLGPALFWFAVAVAAIFGLLWLAGVELS